jgi:cobalt-zinc-cadmium efflux system protein
MAHHHHHTPTTGRAFVASIALTFGFVLAEAAAGWYANSLALLSDAGHNFADGLALLFSFYALRAARKPADARRTFGYHRVGVLAALVNAVSLVLIALSIFCEAWLRLRRPEPVAPGWMIGVALAAVALNGLIAAWLHAGARHDLNVRSAYLHMLGDALSAVGVAAAGVLVALTGWEAADPLVSLLIGGLILYTSWGVLTEAVDVLLESAPRGLDLAEVGRAVRRCPGVLDVHHLHAWTVGPALAACSLHLVVAEGSTRESQQIQQAVARVLEREFHLTHCTIQVEVEDCHAGGPHGRGPGCHGH